MPKRKSSTPSRYSITIPQFQFPFDGESSFNSPKRVTFQSSGAENGSAKRGGNFKRKKLYKTCPPEALVLGDMSFPINNDGCVDFGVSDSDYYVFINDTADFLEMVLEINYVTDKNVTMHLNLNITNEILLQTLNDLMHHKYIWVINNENDLLKGTLNIDVVTTREKMPIHKAGSIVRLFFSKQPLSTFTESYSSRKGFIEEFFKEVQEYQKTDPASIEGDVEHEKLVPELRPYQRRAVQWMMCRESDHLQQQQTDWLSSVVDTYKSKCNQNIYYNKYTGTLSNVDAEFASFPKGGILADEMGLGKTVVVISLILNHGLRTDGKPDDDVLSPYATEVIKSKVVKTTTESVMYNSEVVTRNKETHLDAHEKLLCSTAKKGSTLKKALNEWYESKLAEYSASCSPNKIRRVDGDTVKCICGNVAQSRREPCVQCPDCRRYQHAKCVGFDERYLYYCPPCWSKQKPVRSGATLIIAPTSIYHQWFEEIRKHVKEDGFPNGVFMYNGLREGFIQPSVLATNDIVITTYATLNAEFNHAVQTESERRLRNEERFLKMSCPLRHIRWWRLCLDEAQMVEADQSKINQMVNLIQADNRWSVTGTPIQKSINELYYLVEWLRVEPFTEKSLWDNLLFKPFVYGNKVPLYSVVSKLFWRSSKEDVAHELNLPGQVVNYHFLKFTAIEQNFYMREHAVSSTDFTERLNKLGLAQDRTVDSLDKTTLTSLLAPLLNLRQACSHPMAVKGSKIYSKTGNVTLTELLQYLFNKTKVECEEAMRVHISALNGLAGLHAISEEWDRCVEYYRQVLQLVEEYKDKIHVDSLQRIHTLTNLAEILQCHPEGIPPTLRDDSLMTDAKTLEDKYMQNVLADLNADETSLKGLTLKIEEHEAKFETESGVWWYRLINLLTLDSSIDELRDKIELELNTNEVEGRKQVEFFLGKISSVKGLEVMLRNWLADLRDGRDRALSNLNALRKVSRNDLVGAAVDCHLRTMPVEGKKKKKCQLCSSESVLLDYECTLFDVTRKVLKENYEKVMDGAQTKGSWRAHKAEKCLRALLSVCKTKKNMEAWCLRDGKTHIQMLEAMKKEFKQIRAVWMSINHQVQALDEISMCKLRLRLRMPDEPIPPKMTNLSLREQNKVETIFIIERHEVEHQRLKLASDLDLSKSELRKKYGTLLYLKNLGQKENAKPEPCPVCKSVLDNEWCVLQCGHSYCIDCIRIMLTRSTKASMNCPVCRETTKSSDLSFIDLSGKHEDSDISVTGDHSTKVEGIVRSLLQLKRDDPHVKVLIFSTWVVVLKVLEVALTQNGISFRRMPGYNYQTHLKQFRDPDLGITALLLPIAWGSKGLNLTEASHVFLVEPIMNPAEELQAVGRVHRIGQTKETVVHRFLISRTIEEKIHTAVSESADKWVHQRATLEDLKNLFDMKKDYLTTSETSDKSAS